jgi:hypothetical protein
MPQRLDVEAFPFDGWASWKAVTGDIFGLKGHKWGWEGTRFSVLLH